MERRVNIYLDTELIEWLDKKPRTFNLSKTVRKLLHDLKDSETDGKDRT